MSSRVLRPAVLALLLASCTAEDRAPDGAAAGDPACFGSRVLTYQTLMAEVLIPAGETCASGSFQVVFTRGADTLASLTETRRGVVGFIGTADVDGDGRGEFFVATSTEGTNARGELYAYTDGGDDIRRLPLAPLDSAQRVGYDGGDRFGFGGGNQLVRAFPKAGGDSAWYGYSHGESKWVAIERPSWLR
jgi:hypothetical protein